MTSVIIHLPKAAIAIPHFHNTKTQRIFLSCLYQPGGGIVGHPQILRPSVARAASPQPSSQHPCRQDYHEEPSIRLCAGIPNPGTGVSILVLHSGVSSPTAAPPGDARSVQSWSLQGQTWTHRPWNWKVGVWKSDCQGGKGLGYECSTWHPCENRRRSRPVLCKDMVWYRSGHGISNGPQGGHGRLAQVEQARS